MLDLLDAGSVKRRTPIPGNGKIYHYAKSALAPVATPTIIAVIKASASADTYIRRLQVGGMATSLANMAINVTKRTDDGTVGSAALTALTPARQGTDDGAATASVSTVGTANYTTPGTAQGIVAAGRLNMPALTSGAIGPLFEVPIEQPILLKKGSTEQVTIDLLGAALPSGGVVDINVVTEEVPT